LIHHRRVHLYLTSEQASTYKHLQPSRQTSRVGCPFQEGTTFLPTNTTVLWDERSFTVVNHGETTTTLLLEKGQPIQIPSSFFLQLFETGVITRLGQGEDLPVGSREVEHLLDQASPAPTIYLSVGNEAGRRTGAQADCL
jgi:putative transposase